MSTFHFPETEGNAIDFHTESIDFELDSPTTIESWIKETILSENGDLHFINYIFCSDEYLHKINLEYLDHDTYTDIITFPYREDKIESDIFISIERVRENADKFGVSFEHELYRVIIHGVLHLLGYQDKSPQQQQLMRTKEEEYVNKLLHQQAK